MRIALGQVVSSTDPQENLALVREYARRAAEAGADLLVLPEATMASFATRSADVAEPLDGPWASAVRQIAREVGISVLVGMFTPGAPREQGGRPRARNTLLLAGPDGEQLAHYDKIHLYDAWGFEESRHVEPGDVPVLVELAGVRLGLATCYEVRFPEYLKFLAHEGAQVIVLPASWANGEDKVRQWRALVVARALDTTCTVVAVGQGSPGTVGLDVREGSPTGIGHSLVVGPLGEVLAEAGDGPELIVVDVDAEAIDTARGRLPVLATSRFAVRPANGADEGSWR